MEPMAMKEPEQLEAENERLRYELDDLQRNVRERESAQNPIPWADRPDIRWCVSCGEYHRTDYRCEA